MNVPANILIIDDDPDYVEATRTILEKEGYSVDCAYNATEGYEALSKKKYDLILLDIRMGRGAEGVLLARKLKKEPEMKDIPVLIITGIKEQIATLFPGQALSPHLLPIDELLEKPVDPKELLERISALLAKKRGDK